MRRISARDAKNGFGMLMDAARAAPVAIEKYGRPVVVVQAGLREQFKKVRTKKNYDRADVVAGREYVGGLCGLHALY